MDIKLELQTILSKCIEDLNIFIYENDNSIDWLLSVAQQVECVIIDIDNCDEITKKFITFILAAPNTFYLTKDEITPYNLISKNRKYNLDWIVQEIQNPFDMDNFDDAGDDDDDDDDDD